MSLARVADELGYRTYWLAEHHNMPAVAATNPPVLIAMVAAATERIRVGSGGVMLPNHAPLVVAEQFALLEAAHPGRIDLGIGRAPGTDPVTSCALRHGAGGVSDEAVTRFPEYVDNVLAMMDAAGVGLQSRAGSTRSGRPRARPACRRSGCSGPPTTPRGSRRRRGCPTSSLTTSPAPGPPRHWSCTARRSGPRPSSPSRGPSSPSTPPWPRPQAEADRLALPQLLAMLALRTGGRCPPQPLVEEAEKVELPTPHRDLVDAMRARWVIGDPGRRPAPGSRELAATYDVDEVMVHPVAGAHAGTEPARRPGPRGDAAPAGGAGRADSD